VEFVRSDESAWSILSVDEIDCFERLSDLEGLHFLNGCLLNLLSASSVWRVMDGERREEPEKRRESG
jgi:hypothetical protein